MSAKSTAVAVVSVLLLLVPAAVGGEARQAPLFDDLGRHHHAVTTKSAEAQRYFDQGLTLLYGFNHAEAVRSFREAARLDPDAAMPHWGIALALGPNINAPMSDEAVPQAYAAVRRAAELAAAAKTAEHLKHHDLSKMPFMQWMRATPLLVMVRFGRWDDTLAEPAPAEGALFEQAMWRYARGRAFAGRRDADKAAAESEALSEIASSREAEALQVRDLPGASIVRLADRVPDAEMAGVRGDAEGRLRGLRDSVAAEDALPYMEPPFWEQPVRRLLGSALLEAGRPAEAEAVYREDLRRHPRTGWALFGLLESLRRRGRTAEAAEVQDRLRRAWTRADVVLTGSTF
jgi:tetratricopeptide (TPR) repeat protein